MQKRERWPWVLLLFFLAVVAVGLSRVLKSRVERSNLPRAAALGSGPDGLRVLYEALSRQPGLLVERQRRDLKASPELLQSTLVVAGVSTHDFDNPDWPLTLKLTQMVDAGLRVVLSLDEGALFDLPCSSFSEPGEAAPSSTPPKPAQRGAKKQGLATLWQVRVDCQVFRDSRAAGSGDRASPAVWHHRIGPGRDSSVRLSRATGEGLPAVVWGEGMSFESDPRLWKTVLSVRDKPVMIERRIGRGSVALLSSTFPLSNWAMAEARSTAFVWHVLGERPRILFEETHLGLAEPRGVVSLARSYGLEGALFGLLVATLLFVWHAASPMVRLSRARAAESKGRSSVAALSALCARTLDERALLDLCLKEYALSHATLEVPSQESTEPRGRSSKRHAAMIIAQYNQVVLELEQRKRSLRRREPRT